MTKLRKAIVAGLMTFAIGLPLLLVALYFINPFGARSADPRERVLGFGVYRVPSVSMEPTIRRGQIVFVRAGYYRHHRPVRGDLVTAIAPGIEGPVLKRVVGMPGEILAIHDGQVSVDGHRLVEPYVSADTDSDYSIEVAPMRIGAGHYYLLGDNRDNSADSRMWGPIARSDLLGRVVMETTPQDQTDSYAP